MPNDLIPPDSASIATPNDNAYSVSELAFALKRTLETQFDHVRMRGEVSKVTRHSSGHVYLTLKDDKAAIDGVIWKGSVSRLKTQPDSGLEVIVTGKITTFPASSKYQIVIETMEVAGIGALLAQLERLKQKLHGEGLFDPARKQPLPFAPAVIGVITSPTGAVIRDILHRIRDRWPCKILVWPVVVQGTEAAPQVIAALKGFETGDGGLPRPDVIIVARGGGSVEDLWPFNDEGLARAVAAASIPIISAVGHETDTTLIDYVSDQRAPTPTGAAEMATPVLNELKGLVLDLERRRLGTFERYLTTRRERLALLARALPKPQELLGQAGQRLDFIAHRLGGALAQNISKHGTAYARVSGRFSAQLLERPRLLKSQALAQLSQRASNAMVRRVQQAIRQARLEDLSQRMRDAVGRSIKLKTDRLKSLEQLRLSLNPDRPLDLGFARISNASGELVTSAKAIATGDHLILTFKDGEVAATATEGTASPAKPPTRPATKSAPKKPETPPRQGDLF